MLLLFLPKKAPRPPGNLVGGRSGSQELHHHGQGPHGVFHGQPVPSQAGCDGAAVQAEERTWSVNAARRQLIPTGEDGPLLFRHGPVSSGKQRRGRIPGLRTLQHAYLRTLTTIASARAPPWGALHCLTYVRHSCMTLGGNRTRANDALFCLARNRMPAVRMCPPLTPASQPNRSRYPPVKLAALPHPCPGVSRCPPLQRPSLQCPSLQCHKRACLMGGWGEGRVAYRFDHVPQSTP